MVFSETQSVDRPVAQLKEKFMRLLEVDRASEEFDTLYHEVDTALSSAIAGDTRGGMHPTF